MLIGKGSFGKVYKAEDTFKNKSVALKSINKKDAGETDLQAIWLESDILKVVA